MLENNCYIFNHAIPVSRARFMYSFEHCQSLCFAKRNNNGVLLLV